MNSTRQAAQLPLFESLPATRSEKSVGPWRPALGDGWTAHTSAVDVGREGPDVLRRDLEFLRSMELHGGQMMADDSRRFRQGHEALVQGLVRWRSSAQEGGDDDAEGPPAGAASVLRTLEELGELRLRILEGLPPARADKVMKAETRVRIPEREIESALSLAEFELAEERGDVVSIEIALDGPGLPPGMIGTGMVDAIARSYMAHMKWEQEGRPLPARASLGSLLHGLPVVWLDAVWDALDAGSEGSRRRKEREREIAEHLTAGGTIARIVSEKLSAAERTLLAYLLERGGEASASVVRRRFGSDEGDGWFWNEEPPASPLGRVRLHGLAFVGTPAKGRRTRTVIVPKDVRQVLEKALAGADVEEGSRNEDADPGLPPDIAAALADAYPDGVMDVVWDEEAAAMERDRLHERLTKVAGAQLLYTSSTPYDFSSSMMTDDDESWDDLGEETWDRDDIQHSYTLFFLSPSGSGFDYPLEQDVVDEEDRPHPVGGAGRVGWAVAVSLVASYALMRVSSLESAQEQVTSFPDIERCFFDGEGRVVPADRVFLEMLEARDKRKMQQARNGIAQALKDTGIVVLGDGELGHPVPGLHAGPEILVEVEEGMPPTVEDALFFRYI